MDKMDLVSIARQHGVNGKAFMHFMEKRFPGELSFSYINEWAERFATGNPQTFMDSKSLAIYEEVVYAKM